MGYRQLEEFMEIQIIDVDYVLVNEYPVVRVFGKDEKGKATCIFVEGYRPFFYFREGKGVDLLKNEGQIISIEKVKKNLVEDLDQDVFKVTLKNPAMVPQIRDMLMSNGVTVYEADILFKYRFMSDHNLNGMGWAAVGECNGVNTNTVHSECMVSAKEITNAKRDDNAPLKTLAFDIECVPTVSGSVPEASRDPVIMISLVFSEPYQGKKSVVLSIKPSQSPNAKAFDTEKAMLEEFIRTIKDFDCDMLTGYNINNFDLPYILERMKKCKVRPAFGRCNEKQVIAKKVGAKYRVSITGRVIVDVFQIVKKDFSLQRYGLDFVSEALLGEKKIDVKHSEIEKLWKGSPEDISRLVNYCLKDSILAMNLLEKLNLLDKYYALTRISGTLLQDTLDSGETTRIENFLLREFNRKNYIFPAKPSAAEMGRRDELKKKELEGGYVIEPKKGLHSNVIVLDFASMYPSIIQTYNICPTTLVRKGEVPGALETASGAKFYPREVRRGIVPEILESLIKNRGAVKALLKKNTDPSRVGPMNAKQWALKIMANAFYGYLGYARAKLYDLRIANAITSTGRNTIQLTANTIKEKFGYEIIYGDTDSVFVGVDTSDMDKMGEIGDKIAADITKMLPGVMELQFEKVFKRFLPLTKKRYAAWKFERTDKGWKESIETKGIETVRRDWCGLVGATLKKVIEILLVQDDVKGAVKYFNGVISDIVCGKVDMQKLVITKTMTKSPKSYDGLQPHIELAKKILARNPAEAPGIGDRIGYVIVKGTQLLSKRTEDPRYVQEMGLQVDPKYYIDNQLMPPLERIFRPLGISKSELLGNGKQAKLMDMLVCKAAEPVTLEEISADDFTGFICSKCNRHYERVPLIGLCDCGGGFMFSSPKGPSKTLVFQ